MVWDVKEPWDGKDVGFGFLLLISYLTDITEMLLLWHKTTTTNKQILHIVGWELA